MSKLSTWFGKLPKWVRVISLSILAFITLIFGYLFFSIIFAYAQFASQSSNKAERVEEEVVQENPTDMFTPKVVDLSIDFLRKPLKTDKKFDLTNIFSDEYRDPLDLDDSFVVQYKTGTITKGNFIESEEKTYDLTGYDVYLLSTLEEHDYIYAVRIAYLDDNSPIFVISLDQREPGDIFQVSLKPNVIDITNRKIDQDIFSHNIFKGTKYGDKKVSDKGNAFELDGLLLAMPFEEELSKLEEVDSFGVLKIYNYKVNIGGYSVVQSPEGFLQEVVYVPSIVEYDGTDPIVEIELSKNSEKTRHFYDYISVGGCFGNSLEIADVKDKDLTSIGKVKDGSLVYIKTDKNDSYIKKLYNEDYIAGEMNENNYITEDDAKPFTYEEFVNDNPVFYWEDPFNRYIMFARRDFVMTGGCAKPAIYLYPEQKTSLNVKVLPNGLLTFTYPRYDKGGWNISANPDGNIEYKGGSYDYLWWDSISNGYYTPQNGWVIDRAEFENFITDKLQEMGLNDKEVNDFVEFWIPVINRENSQYLFITFLFNSEVNQIAELDFSVQPDNLFRVFMLYESIDEYKNVKPLKIEKVNRTGFTVVEWGGAKEVVK